MISIYILPKLNYSFCDLEPFIDAHTLGLHYHKHEQNYLNKLNEILEKYKFDYRSSLIELLYNVDEFKESDRENLLFNLGGVLNHNLYWKSMNEHGELPSGRLKSKIREKYGSYEEFWSKFKSKAMALKGSGYTFLVLKDDGEINIMNTSNQDTPLVYGHIPLFTIDLWEHAYYINYENDKEKYIDNFEKIACFKNANKIFEKLATNFRSLD